MDDKLRSRIMKASKKMKGDFKINVPDEESEDEQKRIDAYFRRYNQGLRFLQSKMGPHKNDDDLMGRIMATDNQIEAFYNKNGWKIPGDTNYSLDMKRGVYRPGKFNKDGALLNFTDDDSLYDPPKKDFEWSGNTYTIKESASFSPETRSRIMKARDLDKDFQIAIEARSGAGKAHEKLWNESYSRLRNKLKEDPDLERRLNAAVIAHRKANARVDNLATLKRYEGKILGTGSSAGYGPNGGAGKPLYKSASFSPETRSRILKSANRERILRVCSTIRKGDYTQEEKENPDNFGPVTEPAPKTNVHGDTGKAKLKFTQGYTSRKIIPEDVAAIDLGAEMSAASDKKAQETNDKYKAYLDKHPGLAKQEVETPRTKKIKEYLKSQEFIDHLNGKEGIFMMDGVWYNPFEDKEYSQREINNKAVELWEKIVNDMKINPLKYAESDTSMFKED